MVTFWLFLGYCSDSGEMMSNTKVEYMDLRGIIPRKPCDRVYRTYYTCRIGRFLSDDHKGSILISANCPYFRSI